MQTETPDLAALLAIPGLEDFITESFRQILRREPDLRSASKIARRLRFLPFYSRRHFLGRLLLSEEHSLLRRRQIEEHHLLLDQQRQTLIADRARLDRDRQEFQFLRQVQGKKEIDQQKEQKDWQLVESLVLAKHRHLLELENIDVFIRDSYQELVGRLPTAKELSNWGTRLRSGMDRHKRDLLRHLLVHHAGGESLKEVSSPAPHPTLPRLAELPPKSPKTCRICNYPLNYKWSLEVMHDRYVADYHECSNCGALQIAEPYWLDEAYEFEDQPSFYHPDSGRFMRNFSAYRYVVALHQAGLFAEHPRFLDFGGGYGVLTQMFRDANYEAYQTDPYVNAPFFATDRCIEDFNAIPDAAFDMVSALEVLEHLTDPHEVFARFSRILKPDGTLVLSTGIYEPNLHQSDWPYLWREGGQHVTFWSQAALQYCAGRYGFRSVAYFPGKEGFLILFTHLTDDILRPKLARAVELLQDAHHFRDAIGPWDLLSHGLVRMLPEPIVQNVAEQHPVQKIAA